MKATFDPIIFKTVPPTYSWDEGVPVINGTNLVDVAVDSEGYYIGYAPLAFVSLTSGPVFESDEDYVHSVYRVVNFGDYYNCAQSKLTSLGFDEEYFCHSYVMPGVYETNMSYTKYTTAADVEQQESIYYEQETLDPEQSPIFDLIQESDRGRIFWRWNKLLCTPTELCDTGIENPNTSITWGQAKVGESYAQEWGKAGCFEGPLNLKPFAATKTVSWKWEDILCNYQGSETNKTPITWFQTEQNQSFQRTWGEIKNNCTDIIPSVGGLPEDFSTKVRLPRKLKIIEISPVAYLSAIQPSTLMRVSPLSAVLTARFTKCGSFPIEKIVWDLGDGSPLLTQRRWAIDNSSPFVYTGALSNDVSDPRNYDVVHTYTVTETSGFTFYPGITAYAYSTGTTDCASTIIGPINPMVYDSNSYKIKLLQTNISDEKTFAALYQVNNDVVISKFKPALTAI